MPKWSKNPQKARQFHRRLAQRVASEQHPSEPRPWKVWKGLWPGIGTILVCEEHAPLVGAVPGEGQYEPMELECFICGRDLVATEAIAA